jgi:septum site-determining protein MinC
MGKYYLQKSAQITHNVQLESREEITFQAFGGDSVMVMRGVRSGQKLNIRGNAIIMGDVNPGGEIVASGSIVVMGNCRGLLHAGAEGDKGVFILAYILASRQLRIAEHVATLPEDLGDAPLKMAMLRDDNIQVSDYNPSRFGMESAAQ